MEQSIAQLQAGLMREYYKDFSKYAKGKKPEYKIAWVTSFVPVEILEALGIHYYYPESYAAVLAASGKGQELIAEGERQYLSRDCCSYSCCFEGCVSLERGPRGIPPKPDVLIAANNQCNTLPNWWNLLAHRYQAPLIVLDYPGEAADRDHAFAYVTKQHEDFIQQMEALSGRSLCMETLASVIKKSERSILAWNDLADELAVREVSPTALFDGISFLVTARCKEETELLYRAMGTEAQSAALAEGKQIPIFWLGYPLWYHPKRYLAEILDGFRVCGSDYITWWSLDYTGNTPLESLFEAYNYTFLNLTLETRTRRLMAGIQKSKAVCTVTLHNKSCKCDFVSAMDIRLPQAELETDMIDHTFFDAEKARRQMALLKETVCIG